MNYFFHDVTLASRKSKSVGKAFRESTEYRVQRVDCCLLAEKKGVFWMGRGELLPMKMSLSFSDLSLANC